MLVPPLDPRWFPRLRGELSGLVVGSRKLLSVIVEDGGIANEAVLQTTTASKARVKNWYKIMLT